MRSVFTVVIAAILAVLLLTTVITPKVHAADASWTGSAISYEGNSYHGPASDEIIAALGLFEGVQAYTYVEPAPNIANPSSGSSSSSNSPPSDRNIHVIYFGADVDVSSATTAKYRTYTYENRTTFTNPSNPVDINIQAQSTATSGTSACQVEGGVGWWICPITNFLAWGMDQIFNLLSGFLTVQPPQIGQDNALYRAWSYMRSIANVAFVIVFLIIIYSQISSIGIDSYGIKKLLPRLIVAALLVNLSYFICAIAIDISNIFGYALQDIFLSIRNTLVGPEGNGYDIISWESITGFILSGGTVATAGLLGGFVVLADFGVVGSLFLLLPALVSGLLAVLVALFIMAARQAIITILVIIAPLAFVAYLLPNTEKWFEKWRSVFVTMLVLFPAFSLVFGGSQLAGTAIIQNADSINLVLLGMMVQVAPLFITPLLLRLGGDLLRQIGGLANKPRQALQNKVNDFSKDRANNWKQRRLGELDPNRSQPLRRAAHWREGRRRNREGLAEAAKAETDARWEADARHSAIDERTRLAADVKSLAETGHKRAYEAKKIVADNATELSKIQRTNVDLKNMHAALEDAETEVKVQYENMRAGESDDNTYIPPTALAQHAIIARQHYQKSQLLSSQIQSAEGMQKQAYAKALKESEALRQVAGGISRTGSTRALAAANAVIDQALDEAIKNIQTTSEVEAGQITELVAKLDEAAGNNDVAAMVAYINKLGDSRSEGFDALHSAIERYEANGSIEADSLKTVKQYVNASATLNEGSEAIGSWSRDRDRRSLAEVTNTVSMWRELTPEAFSRNKKSSQMRALDVPGAVTRTMAMEIFKNDDLRKNVKASVKRRMKTMFDIPDELYVDDGEEDDD